MQRVIKYSLLTTLILAASSQAEEGFRQHSAHVHGHVEFNIAQDGNELLVEITAPGADVVGFEHAPTNEQQHLMFDKAKQTLGDSSQLLRLSQQAGCQVEHTSVTSTLDHDDHEHEEHADHDDHEHEEHADHDDHEHEEHADHDDHEHEEHADHDDHEHEEHADHDDHDHEGSTHSEFTVEYHFECNDMSKLQNIETTWFEHFPSTDNIAVNLLTDTEQKALKLNKDDHVITF
ncbi:zinc uptake protein ZrgA [Vibrio sp. MA40-2]|uniref:zinc uptake protein ZrgA n=1 Tax=Vibrio sp. MA40-2 TaxID=3391828 RepID=UPI0039A6D4BF